VHFSCSKQDIREYCPDNPLHEQSVPFFFAHRSCLRDYAYLIKMDSCFLIKKG
jgi:hypothetical protein